MTETLFIEQLDGFTYQSFDEALEAHEQECEWLVMAYAESMGAGGSLVLPRWTGNKGDD